MTVESTMEEIEKLTSLVGFIIVGGPEPRSNGDIMVMSYALSLGALEQQLIALRAHTGKVRGGLDFSKSYDEWQSTIKEPFIAHLNDIVCKSALLLSACLCINYPQAREDCLAHALPKRAKRNTPALPLAKSSCPPAESIGRTATSREVADKESDSSCGPGNVVGTFSLDIK